MKKVIKAIVDFVTKVGGDAVIIVVIGGILRLSYEGKFWGYFLAACIGAGIALAVKRLWEVIQKWAKGLYD